MAEGRGEIELYNQWFQLADTDKDGVLSGAEAVQFFLRSGLPQNPTLFKVWQYVAGDNPSLTRQEFYTAMKLVSLAQANGGILNDQQARKIVNGLLGPVPPPSMIGLASPVAPSTAPHVPARPAPSPPAPGAFASAGANAFPPLSPDKVAAFQTAFDQLDSDRDGYVQGVDCFATFMRSGLSKAALKEIWDVVAGEQGQLNRHQFVQSLYLIECCKVGIPVPRVLPAGQFPPIQGSGFGLESMVSRPQSDIYSGATLSVPSMPQRAVYAAGPAPQVAFQSAVPAPPSAQQSSGLSAAEAQRLQAEREAALAQEAQRRRAEEERVAAAARREFYTQSLADLRVAQGKVSRMLVEAQQRLEMERSEASTMETQYNAAYEAFSAEHARAAPLLEAMKTAEEQKSALVAKLSALQAAVAQLEGVDPEWEHRERGECEAMRKEITELTAKHEGLQRTADAVASRRDELESAIVGLKAASERASAQVEVLQSQIKDLTSQQDINGASAIELLRQLAPLYNDLYAAARAAMLPLPKEALATIVRPPITAFKYDALRFGGMAADWEAFDDEGFTIAAALPRDARLMSLTSPSLAAAEEAAATAAQAEENIDVDNSPDATLESAEQQGQDESGTDVGVEGARPSSAEDPLLKSNEAAIDETGATTNVVRSLSEADAGSREHSSEAAQQQVQGEENEAAAAAVAAQQQEEEDAALRSSTIDDQPVVTSPIAPQDVDHGQNSPLVAVSPDGNGEMPANPNAVAAAVAVRLDNTDEKTTSKIEANDPLADLVGNAMQAARSLSISSPKSTTSTPRAGGHE